VVSTLLSIEGQAQGHKYHPHRASFNNRVAWRLCFREPPKEPKEFMKEAKSWVSTKPYEMLWERLNEISTRPDLHLDLRNLW